MDKLTNRQLNRATLARQMLLERSDMGIAEAVDWLIGLQGQVSEGPYQGLWSRLAGFRHEDLTQLIVERTLVRATSFRATLHLHTVDDLIGRGWVSRDQQDRLCLTAGGRTAHQITRQRVQQTRGLLLRGVSADQYGAVIGTLAQMAANLQTSAA